MKLLVVESPAKAKTIKGYLNDEFEVLASIGHFRDLPEKGMGIEENEEFSVKKWELRKLQKSLISFAFLRRDFFGLMGPHKFGIF